LSSTSRVRASAINQTDDVLFINASGPENFGEEKRQNRPRDEDIDKIVQTYQFRKEEERYSKRVSMEQIKEEGYNLNISRYISTARAESDIDLAATHDLLEIIENAIQKATSKHNDFLGELGLAPLPCFSIKLPSDSALALWVMRKPVWRGGEDYRTYSWLFRHVAPPHRLAG
jgi:hypothetical protein